MSKFFRNGLMTLAAAIVARTGISLFGADRAHKVITNTQSGRKADKRDRARIYNEAARRTHYDKRRVARANDPEKYARLDAVDTLTNYERNQWAREGYKQDPNLIRSWKGARQRMFARIGGKNLKPDYLDPRTPDFGVAP